jgi:hypothetical protein
MDSNEMRKSNAADPNSVTIDGGAKTTINRDSHCRKAPSPICVTEIGMQVDFNELQPQKTWKGII